MLVGCIKEDGILCVMGGCCYFWLESGENCFINFLFKFGLSY